jgi:hypothetical protein
MHTAQVRVQLEASGLTRPGFVGTPTPETERHDAQDGEQVCGRARRADSAGGFRSREGLSIQMGILVSIAEEFSRVPQTKRE